MISSNGPNEGVAQPVLEAVHLSKQYDGRDTALRDVSFSVRPGQSYVMLGANGAGKTTTINLFLNLIEPTSGEARIKGYASHLQPLEAKKHVAFVSENVMLYGNITALQNLAYFARLGGRENLHTDFLKSVLLKVGLEEGAHGKKVRDFSKGMRQKCGLAIAIAKDADAILLDEPTSGLDPKAGYEFLQLMTTLRESGKAILMSTHDLFRAREVATTVAILKEGQIVLEEPASALAGKDLEEIYIQHMVGN